jgi:hypothetical protein
MNDIERRLLKIEADLEEFGEDTKKILFYLESDPQTKKKGIVEILSDTEERVRILELQRKLERVRNGTLAGVVSSAIVIFGFVVEQWIRGNILLGR